MEREIKTIPYSRGVLYALANMNRYVLAECDAMMEFTVESNLAILKARKGDWLSR